MTCPRDHIAYRLILRKEKRSDMIVRYSGLVCEVHCIGMALSVLLAHNGTNGDDQLMQAT